MNNELAALQLTCYISSPDTVISLYQNAKKKRNDDRLNIITKAALLRGITLPEDKRKETNEQQPT